THLKRYDKMPQKGYGMPVVSNVSVGGQSPNLLCNYTLTLYVIPRKGDLENMPQPDTRIVGTTVTGGGSLQGAGGGGGGIAGGGGGVILPLGGSSSGLVGGSTGGGGGGNTSTVKPTAN